MPTLLLKSWRDLRARRWQALGLALLVATIVAAAAGASRAGRMMVYTREVYQRDLALADLEIRCSPVLSGLLERVHDIPGVEAAEETLVLDGVLESRAPYPLPAAVRVLPEERTRLNQLGILAGRYPAPGELGVVLDRSLRKVFGLEVGESVDLEIHGVRHRLPVVGISLSPDHILFPCHPEFLFPVPGTVASLSLSAAAAAEYPNTHLVNVLRFRLEAGHDPKQVEAQLLDELGVSPIAVFPRDDAPDQRATSTILRFFDVYIPAGLSVLMLVALTLMVLTLTRVVRSEERQIGLLVAAGHRPRAIAAGYVLLPLLSGVAGAIIGGLAHGAYARFIYESYARGLGYAPLRDPGLGLELPVVAAICLVVAAAVAYGLALATAARCPSRLLSPAPSRTGAFRPIATLLARTRRIGRLPMSVVLGITYLSRRPWVSLATVVCLGLNLGMVAAYVYVHETHVEETEQNMSRIGRDATVHFSSPVSDEVVQGIGAEIGGTAEPMISTNLVVDFPGGRMFHPALCLTPNGWLRAMPIVRGRGLDVPSAQELLIDQWVSDAHGVDLGDTLTCYPWFSAPESASYEIVGVTGGPTHGMLVLPLETGRVLVNLPGLANAAAVSSPLPAAALEARLRGMADVESVQSLTRARERVGETFAGLERVLIVCVVLAVIVSVIFLGLLAALDARQRAPDLAVLRAVGWRDRSILALCVTEVAARGALGFLLAVPLSSLLAEWLLARLQDANRYRLELVAPWWVLALIAGTCAVLIPLSAYPAWRAAQRVSPAAAIRLLANE